MLHLVFQSCSENAVLERLDAGDSVVFLENAVLRLFKNTPHAQRLHQLLSGKHGYVLNSDLEVRGISATELISGLSIIDYPGLVELTAMQPLIQSWN